MSSLSSFQLKGGLFPLTALQITDPTLTGLTAHLTAKIQQAPQFFKKSPIVVDLQKIKEDHTQIDFSALLNSLKALELIPIGVRGGSPSQIESALQAGLASFPEVKAAKEDNDAANAQAQSTSSGTKLFTQPIRSGQQVCAHDGDVIVHASVSNGAEVLASGHVHIYGPLRGRVLAGIHGNKESRIFCQSLEAELISICGHYQVYEDLSQHPYWRESVVISLDGEKICIDKL